VAALIAFHSYSQCCTGSDSQDGRLNLAYLWTPFKIHCIFFRSDPFFLFPTPPHMGEELFWSNEIRFPLYALFLGFIGMLFEQRSLARVISSFFVCFNSHGFRPYVGLWKFVHSLPILKYFRFPFSWLFFLPICVSFFSARGVDHLLDRPNGFSPVGFGRVQKSILLTGLGSLGVVFLIRYHSEIVQQTRKALEFSPWLTGLLWLCTIGMVLAAFLSLTKSATRRGVVLGVTLTVISLFATLAFMIQDPMIIRNLGAIGWKGDNRPNELQTYRTSSALSPYDVWRTNTIPRHYHYTPNLQS
jgi:hypothetical protein